MELRVRTTDPFPRYLKANFVDAKDAQWTHRDTRIRTWEDDAEGFNMNEADCIIKELAVIGITAEIC